MPPTPATAPLSPAGFSDQVAHERAIDFASHSWDLATGGLKTLTAKRELPPLPDRMLSGKLQEPVDTDTPQGYTFILIILACVLLMLISGGVVLFVMLQP